MKDFKLKIKEFFYKLKQMKHWHEIEIALMAVCSFALLFFVVGILPNLFNQSEKLAYVYSPVTTTKESGSEQQLFGDEGETVTESTTSSIIFEIDTQMKNIQIASGDSKKDEDAEINRDYGTNSSRLSPASSPTLSSRITGNTVSSDLITSSSLSSLVYVNRSYLTGLNEIDGTLFNFNNSNQPVTGHQAINDVQYYFNENGALASVVGIDVSHHNGKIDWQAVKNAGVDFAIIRVGFRGYGSEGTLKLDSRFDENMSGAISAGIQVGVYFYSQAISVAEAVEEASVAVNYSRKYNVSYPIYFDTEFANDSRTGRADSLSVGQRTNVTVAFCEAVKNAGYKPGIYASKTFFTDELNFSRLSGYQIWVAHYTSETTDFKYNYKVWQYTPKGTVSGIPNKTDINISLYDYKNSDDMSGKGSNIAFFDSDDDIANAQNAEKSIKAYQMFKTEVLYNTAYNQVEAIQNGKVKDSLKKVLDDSKNKYGFLVTTTVSQTDVTVSDEA